MGKSDATAARLPQAETERTGAGAALRSQDDGAEPGAGDALAGDVYARRESAAQTIPPASLRRALHARGRRVAGHRGRGSRHDQRAGHAEASATGALRLPRRPIHAPGGVVGGAVVPHAEEPRLPSAIDDLPTNAAHQNIYRRAAPARAQWPARLP